MTIQKKGKQKCIMQLSNTMSYCWNVRDMGMSRSVVSAFKNWRCASPHCQNTLSGGSNESLYYKGHSEKKNVTKLSTSREDQIIRNIFFKAKMIDCKNGKIEHKADRKGNQDKKKNIEG